MFFFFKFNDFLLFISLLRCGLNIAVIEIWLCTEAIDVLLDFAFPFALPTVDDEFFDLFVDLLINFAIVSFSFFDVRSTERTSSFLLTTPLINTALTINMTKDRILSTCISLHALCCIW